MSAKIFGIGGADVIQFLQAGVGAVVRTLLSKLQSISIDPMDFEAVGDGVTDDTAAIQAAIDHATTLLIGNSFIDVDLAGKTYGVGSTILLKTGVNLKKGGLIAVGSAWAITDPMISAASTENAGLSNVSMDFQWKCAGILRNSAKRSNIDKIKLYRFKTYGIKDTGVTQESTLTNAVIKQYLFGDAGYDAAANRDAYGIWVDTADSQYSNIVTAYSGTPLYITGALNQFNNIHAYNGATTDGGEITAIQIEGTDASNNVFNNIYADNGVIKVIDNFKQTFNNVLFQHTAAGTNTKGFEFITSAVGEMGDGLALDNILFNGTYSGGKIVFSTTGSGSWDGTKNIYYSNIRMSDGSSTGIAFGKWGNKFTVDAAGDLNLLTTGSVFKIGGTQVLGPRETGWTASTGVANKGAYATYAGQTMSAGYVQAEAQALDDAVKAVSERLKALEDKDRTHGLIN
jgi:hypothetical protein